MTSCESVNIQSVVPLSALFPTSRAASSTASAPASTAESYPIVESFVLAASFLIVVIKPDLEFCFLALEICTAAFAVC